MLNIQLHKKGPEQPTNQKKNEVWYLACLLEDFSFTS